MPVFLVFERIANVGSDSGSCFVEHTAGYAASPARSGGAIRGDHTFRQSYHVMIYMQVPAWAIPNDAEVFNG